LIDPIGFGFEKFDALGARHDKFKVAVSGSRRNPENRPASIELEVDTKAFIAGIENSDFSSPRELGQILASNRQCQECVVKQLFRYAAGRTETPADKPILDRSYENFQRSQFRFKELMIAVIKWTEFTPGRI
jgi:hypothetical protein